MLTKSVSAQNITKLYYMTLFSQKIILYLYNIS